MTTDKACYTPGQVVVFSASGSLPSNAYVRYRHGAMVLESHKLSDVMSNNRWTWTPPTTDYQGYLVELFAESNGTEVVLGTIAVDVSSNWKRFPRYGFVADFNNYDGSFHINKKRRRL